MNIYHISSKCAVFTASAREKIGKTEAESLVKRMLAEKHMQWCNIGLDMFCSGEDVLFIAYPVDGLKITIAPYALPFIAEYFTE